MTLLVLMLQLVIALGTLRVAAAVAVPFTPTLFFNFSLSPLSPSLTFVPDMQTNRVGKDQFPPPWNTTFSDALWSSYVSGQVGVGKPRTFIHGPARLYGPLRIDYTGTGLYIEGEYDLSNRTDESSDWNRTGPPQPNDPLRSINFASGQSTTSYFGSRNRSTFKVLAQDTDSFSESAKPNFISAQGSIKISEEGESSIYFALDTFVVETGMRTNATTLGDVSTRVEYAVVDGGPEPGLNRNLLWQKGPEAPSHWQVSTELNGIAQSSTPYSGQRTAVTTTLTDEFGMAIPRGTAFIVVNGTTGPTKGWARISLKHEGLGTTVREPVLTNPWISVETIFWAPLDPSLQHNLTIVPITGPANVTKGRYSNGIGLHSVTLYAAGKKQSESKSKFQIEDEPPEYKNG
ncbi:hypothetical protein Q8F55_003105 [Vanrija albida]|uniref:Uncharacterized protein n=1 Tax=Vanrija albida TaxID=181172 RepID=A0ABR3QBK3_9TREE